MWKALPGIPAVRNHRVTIVRDDRTVIPGPRVGDGTELIARALHPEAFAEMKILVSWSSGKDSAWMLHVLRRDGSARRRRC